MKLLFLLLSAGFLFSNYLEACGGTDTGTINSIGAIYCGTLPMAQVSLSTGCAYDVPQTALVGLLTYAMDQQKSVTMVQQPSFSLSGYSTCPTGMVAYPTVAH